MSSTSKRRALKHPYVSQNQLVLNGFETPFSQTLDPSNRWVKLAGKIPWDELVGLYLTNHEPKDTGRPGLNPRILIGAVMIKHICNLDDRETVSQITENIYMQYFLGYSAFSTEPPFDPSLFVDIRKRLNDKLVEKMNHLIVRLSSADEPKEDPPDEKSDTSTKGDEQKNRGELLMDATVAPQDIAYPTDLKLLNKAREISEKVIDVLHISGQKKPRTYRKKARKDYLNVAQNRNPSRKTIRKAISKQLKYLRRNMAHIHKMLDHFEVFPLPHKLQRQFWVIQTLYDQQLEMFTEGKHRVDDRIVSIHQPHVRPIVRGKSNAPVEFGAKLHLSMVDGFSFLDIIGWDAFHEGNYLSEAVENYKNRFGFYPERVLADKIYCTRANRKWLAVRNIKLAAKPLGRPSAKAVEHHVRPGERNPIEGKFGQAKNGYGMNRIRARLKQTSQSWIASIILVLNLVKLAGQAPYCLSFSACYLRFQIILQLVWSKLSSFWIKYTHQDQVRPVF